MNRSCLLFCLGVLATGSLPAKEPTPVPPTDGLTCTEARGGVLLQWSFVFVAPIRGWVIARDGTDIVKLPAEDSSYFDASVPAGLHVYNLKAVNFTGEILDLAKCEVKVDDSGLRCTAEENKVHIEWDPPLIDVLILKYRIARDGDTIGIAPPSATSFDDQVFSTGLFHYAVYAVTSPDSEFLIGTCTVGIRCFGLSHEVVGLEVRLKWANAPVLNPLAFHYLVTRDGELVAKTELPEAVDKVPVPGTYLYQVYLEYNTPSPPIRLIAECHVAVPGDGIPAPTNLTCAVLLVSGPIDPVPLDPSSPAAVDRDGDGVVDSLFPRVVIDLNWEDPIQYDKIAIVRNGVLIATLDGAAVQFRDIVRAGGVFAYAVHGILGDVRSPAAECKVEVPPPFVLPPQDFKCEVIIALPEPSPVDTGNDVNLKAAAVVVLTWSNPIRYSKLLISRDGAPLVSLPGDATGYKDWNPPAGTHTYSIVGAISDGRTSPAVTCEVEIGCNVPPVANLECLVEQPSSTVATGSVILVWENPVDYDRIFLTRNGEVIFEDTGELRKYRDLGLEAGVYTYCVVGTKGRCRSAATCCQVMIQGSPRRNLLYFTQSLPAPEPVVDLSKEPPIPSPLPPLPGNRITCLADNTKPVQGWSFGVGSDPKFIVPLSANIRGTATQAFHGGQGPEFLHIDVLADGTGVVMAVVIDTGEGSADPAETLPPARGHRLLNIIYGPGPEGRTGEAYPVRYTSQLGDPPVQVLFVVDGFEVEPPALPGWVSLPGPHYLRGDSNADGQVDISDGMFTLVWLFLGGKEPACLEAANANGSTQVNLADPIYTFNFLFSGGSPPPFPYPFCAVSAAPVGCEQEPPCISPTGG